MKDLLRENRSAAADKVRAAADKMLKQFERTYKKKDVDDREMLIMGRKDKKDLYKVATYIDQGRLDLAGKLADSMDTASRELIPAAVWSWL